MSNVLRIAVACSLFVLICASMHAQIKGCDSPCNLIINGNFSAGNVGFTSDLPMKCNACTAGSYCVGPTFASKCSSWPAASFDHTVGTAAGSYLLVDGVETGAPKDFWKKSVKVCPGVTYTFSFWAKNLYAGGVDVGMMINGTRIGPTASVSTTGWVQYSVTWTSNTSVANLALRQLTAGAKEDFGVDDIFFGFCFCACSPQ